MRTLSHTRCSLPPLSGWDGNSAARCGEFRRHAREHTQQRGTTTIGGPLTCSKALNFKASTQESRRRLLVLVGDAARQEARDVREQDRHDRCLDRDHHCLRDEQILHDRDEERDQPCLEEGKFYVLGFRL